MNVGSNIAAEINDKRCMVACRGAARRVVERKKRMRFLGSEGNLVATY